MMKWFEEVNLTRPAVICSRVRLVRNLEEYAFPSRLDEQQADEMIGRLEEALKGLGSVDGRHYEQARLQELSDLDRRALRERRVFNSTIASGKAPAGVMVSDDEQVGIVLNGTDHIRIQLFAAGLHLDELMNQAGQIDDYLNERFDYAFDEKCGHRTSGICGAASAAFVPEQAFQRHGDRDDAVWRFGKRHVRGRRGELWISL